MANQILVIGSSNTDMVVKSDRLPAPGETVLGGTFLMNPGGKGANQAVAAARLGGDVTFVAKVGNDVFGEQAVTGFRQEGIRTDFILTDSEYPSGVALINVDAAGENCITVAPGANANLQPTETDVALQQAEPNAIVLIQLETPLPTVGYVAQKAAERSLRVILNPAPAQTLPSDLLAHLFLITPNETEAELLTGIRVTDVATAELAAQKLRELGISNVVITLGAKGAYISTDDVKQLVSGPRVTAVDSTAAGDCFNGALAVSLAEGQSWVEAVTFACKAASLSVTRMGAQASMPTRDEIS
ncbi:ribokinase [Spirosoma flavus]